MSQGRVVCAEGRRGKARERKEDKDQDDGKVHSPFSGNVGPLSKTPTGWFAKYVLGFGVVLVDGLDDIGSVPPQADEKPLIS